MAFGKQPALVRASRVNPERLSIEQQFHNDVVESERRRETMGNGFAGRLMDCFQCLSIWVAAPLALLVVTRPLDWLLVWLALSGAACLLERIGQEPVVIQPLTEDKTEGQNYGMLRTRPDNAPEHGLGNDQNSARIRESNSAH